jgi:GT2 family glycosyltransferase
MKPRISIITPSYNQAQFLEETIESVLAQRPDLWEYIVLDGGSTDGSRVIIERFGPQLTRWRSERDGGQSEAIDSGIRMATGDVVGWLNSDDVLLPGSLRAVQEAFAQDPDLQVVVGGLAFVDASSRIIRVVRPPRQTLAAALWGITHVPQPACFFRKSLYETVGGIDRGLHVVLDTELWYRMLRVAPHWGHVDRVLAAFRIHPSSKGQSWNAAYAQENALLRRRYPEFSDRSIWTRLGRLAYIAGRAASLSYARDYLLSARVRGQRLTDVRWPKGHGTAV